MSSSDVPPIGQPSSGSQLPPKGPGKWLGKIVRFCAHPKESMSKLFEKKEPEFFHLGGTNLASYDPKNEYTKLNFESYYGELITIPTKEGDLHIYGNILKQYINEWIALTKAGQTTDSFQTYMKNTIESNPAIKAQLEKVNVRYFTDEDRRQTEVHVTEKGLAQIGLDSQDSTLKPLSSGKNYAFTLADMVIDDQLTTKLYASPKVATPNGKIQHSSFFRGGNVKSAGMLSIRVDENGRTVLSIKNMSGHYRPSEREIAHLLKYLQDNGYNMANLYVEFAKWPMLSGALRHINSNWAAGITIQRADIWYSTIGQKHLKS